MKNLKIKNLESGVSLIITFFILVIVLAVVLSISVILYSELKIIRNIGDSVVAFYSADSGVEKTLYYDRKILPEGMAGSMRGICNICASCPAGECLDCTVPATEGCDPLTCENCEVTFNSDLSGGKTYKVTARVSQVSSSDDPPLQFSELSINSVGSYNSVLGADPIKRAIELKLQKGRAQPPPPALSVSATAVPPSVSVGEQVNFIAIASEGTGIYSYVWSGDCVGTCSETALPCQCSTSFPSAGNYTATVTVESGTESISASAMVNVSLMQTSLAFSINPTSIGRGGTVNFSADLRDSGGNSIPGKQISFSGAPSAIADCTTGSNCSFAYTVPSTATYKTYTIVANFSGDSFHAPATDSKNLFVKRSTTLTADASPVPSTGGTTYVAAVLKSGTSNLSGKTLNLKDAAGNILASGITDSSGVVLFYNVPAMAPGTHINYFTVSFEGDSSYLSSFVNVNLIVTP